MSGGVAYLILHVDFQPSHSSQGFACVRVQAAQELTDEPASHHASHKHTVTSTQDSVSGVHRPPLQASASCIRAVQGPTAVTLHAVWAAAWEAVNVPLKWAAAAEAPCSHNHMPSTLLQLTPAVPATPPMPCVILPEFDSKLCQHRLGRS
jgi:hypothetical protein